jgi:DNA polymerase-3 subunit epsilon
LIDTLALARDMYPGKRNGLDALCERFGIDNAHRSIHGALLDAQLLAEAYLAMTRGQESLTIDMAAPSLSAILGEAHDGLGTLGAGRPHVAVIEPTAAELAEHFEYLAALAKETSGRCVACSIRSRIRWPRKALGFTRAARPGVARCVLSCYARTRRSCRPPSVSSWPSTTCRRS